MKRRAFWIFLTIMAALVMAPVMVRLVRAATPIAKTYIWRLNDKSPPGTSKKDRDAAVKYLDGLYWRYLREDVKGARAAMIEACAYIKKSPIPELKGGLILAYGRLSLLEERCGNPQAADLYYAKARSVAHDRDAFTRQECRKVVTHWDETYTKNAGPRYAQLLDKRNQQSKTKPNE